MIYEKFDLVVFSPGGPGAQGAKMRFGQSMGMPHIKTTAWTRGFTCYHFQVFNTKNEATRAKKSKNWSKLYFLVLFGAIFTEYGLAVHQNGRLEEGSHMHPFFGPSDQNCGRQSQKLAKVGPKTAQKRLYFELWFKSSF